VLHPVLKPEAHGFNLIADLGLTEHLHHPYLDGNKHPRVIGEGRVQPIFLKIYGSADWAGRGPGEMERRSNY